MISPPVDHPFRVKCKSLPRLLPLALGVSLSAVVRASGLKIKFTWTGGEQIKCSNKAYRRRATFGGLDAAGIRFYALYLK